MAQWAAAGRSALISGAVASVTSSVALVLLAKAEGKHGLQPVNATSHWLNGSAAAAIADADWRHTGLGYTTHHLATMFWAVPFELWLGADPTVPPGRVLGRALAVSAIAAVADYGATPKRFTPGWEFVLSRRAMALVYGTMALGLAGGTLWARQRSGRTARA